MENRTKKECITRLIQPTQKAARLISSVGQQKLNFERIKQAVLNN